MLREAQQEEASRLGSKSFFDLSPFFSVFLRECWHIHKAGDCYPVPQINLCFLSPPPISNCKPFLFHLDPFLLLPVAMLLKHSYCKYCRSAAIKASSLLSFCFLCSLSLLLSFQPCPTDNRSHPAGSWSMGEVDAGPVHFSDSWQLHQRPVCPHWHRDRHHCVWPVRMLRHLQRKPMDAEAGERPQDEGWSVILQWQRHAIDAD